MKLTLISFFLFVAALVPSAQAQAAPHSATLTWVPAQGQTGQTFNALRATGLCTGTPTYSTLATAITVNTYVDNTVTPGNYCYVVTATLNGVTSPPSNTASAAIPVTPPTLSPVLTTQVLIPIPYEYSSMPTTLS